MNEPSNFDTPETSEEDRVFNEAYALGVEILNELDRIRNKIGRSGGLREYERLFNEIFRPEKIDRSTLLSCVAYHGLIASSPPPNLQTDLPGDQSVMIFAKRKLEELKQI